MVNAHVLYFLVFEQILHVRDLVFDLQQLLQHNLAVRADGSRKLPPDVPGLVRNICACELRDLLKVVWVYTSIWSAIFSKVECSLGEAYTFRSNAPPNCNDSSVTLMQPCSRRRLNSPFATLGVLLDQLQVLIDARGDCVRARCYNIIPHVFEHGHSLQSAHNMSVICNVHSLEVGTVSPREGET